MIDVWLNAKVTDIIQEGPNTRRFFLKITDNIQFSFLPGQFITFDLPIHSKLPLRLRSYSIASPPTGNNEIELVIVLNPGGKGTEYFFNEVKTGSELKFKGPLGKFLLPTVIDRDLCFICTGTGIAPFRSMLYFLYENFPEIFNYQIYLIFGTRTEKDILYHNEMLELSKLQKNLHYTVTLSKAENSDWKGQKGYVHPVYQKLFNDRRPAYFYICGWKNMLMEARENLQKMGYAKEFIKFELYG